MRELLEKLDLVSVRSCERVSKAPLSQNLPPSGIQNFPVMQTLTFMFPERKHVPRVREIICSSSSFRV